MDWHALGRQLRHELHPPLPRGVNLAFLEAEGAFNAAVRALVARRDSAVLAG